MKGLRLKLLFGLMAAYVAVFIVFGIIFSQLLRSFYERNLQNPEIYNQLTHYMVVTLIICLCLGFIIIYFLVFQITSIYSKPIEDATKVANELAKGNYRARTSDNNPLSHSINILATNLEEMKKSHEMEHARLGTLIENMGSGLILVDKRGNIILLNRAFKDMFRIENDTYMDKLYYEVISHKQIISIVEEIFMIEKSIRKQIQVTIHQEQHHFEVYGAPILGTKEEWKGIVLVFHDISDIKRLEQMRKDFVANVSHELKTPITSIKGFSETLLDGAMNDKETLTYFLSIILKESDRLQSLIQDLLELSKLEQNNPLLQIEIVEINETVNDVYQMLRNKAQKKGISLHINIPNQKVFIMGDMNRLKQVFINMISNSITYTGQGGHVTVEVKEMDDIVEIVISDTGIGIDEQQLPRIFERFYRVDRARSRNSGGTGLGLAIVKHIVEAHHGNINVESKVGEGTTFTVQLQKK